MKIIKQYGGWYTFLIYLIMFCSMIITSLFYQQINYLFYLAMIPLILVLILACTNKSKTVLGEEKNHSPSTSITKKIILWQIMLFFSFLLFQHLTLSFFHAKSTNILSNNALLKYTLLPWPTITLLSCGLAYIAFELKRTAFFYSLLCYKNISYNRTWVSSIANSALGLLNTTVICLTLGLLAITLGLQFFSSILTIHTGWTIASIATIIVIVVSRRLILNNKILNIIQRSHTNFSLTMIIYVVFSGLIIGLILGAAQIILHQTSLPPFHIVKYLTSINKEPIINLIFNFWWLGWISTSALYIAKNCRGSSIRRIIISTLSFPMTISLVLLLSNYLAALHYAIQAALNSDTLILLLGITATFGLIYVICNNLHGNIIRSAIATRERNRALTSKAQLLYYTSISNQQIFLLLNIPAIIAIAQGVFAITAFLFIAAISMTSFIILIQQKTITDAE